MHMQAALRIPSGVATRTLGLQRLMAAMQHPRAFTSRSGSAWERRATWWRTPRRTPGALRTPAAAAAADHANTAASPSTPPPSTRRPPRVCIVGGGFGGLYTAIKLDSLAWPAGTKPSITLVDQGERFVFKPLLYELLNGTASEAEVAPMFDALLAPYPVRFVRARVTGVEHGDVGGGGDGMTAAVAGGAAAAAETTPPPGAAGRVLLEGGGSLEYDWLVVALGAAADARGVPGARERARAFATLDDALHAKRRLDDLEASVASGAAATTTAPPVVVVVGGGFAGVELAAVIAERAAGRLDVQLVTPGSDVLQGASAGQRGAARRVLDELGVTVLARSKVQRLEDAAGGAGGEQASSSRTSVVLEPAGGGGGDGSDGSSSAATAVVADLVLWTAGSAPATRFERPLPFAAASPASGGLATLPTLQVRGEPRVFAVGDVSITPDTTTTSSSSDATKQQAQLPATAQVAFQQADYAAWNVWAAINGRPQLPFRYQHLGAMMSLGATNAAVALPFSLPPALSAGMRGSPLEPLLALGGVRVGGPAGDNGGVTVEGPLAQALRRAAYLYRQPTNEQRLSVVASWVQQAVSLAQQLSGGGGART